jgi:nucleolar protein 14
MKDYQTNKKSNTMVDRRFGEMDPTMSLEEKMFLRFQKERTRHVRKSSSYNLGDSDNELLTHRGQVLGSSNINDADWVSSDDEDPSLRDAGRLDRDVVNALHFGGGLRPKDGDASVRGTKLDALQEIVMKSKLHKMQKREAKEEQETERTKLDRAYEELMGTSLLTFDSRTGSDRRPEGGRYSGEDAYDQSLVEMMYEARLPASERTKSAEELALEEQRRIEDLETRRLERMKAGPVTTGGVNEGVQGRKRGAGRHVSDDAIDDDSFRCNNGPADRQTGRGVAGEDSAAYNEYIRVDDIQDEEYEDSEEDGEEGSDCDGEEDEGDDSGGEDSDDGDEDSEDADDNGEDDSDDNDEDDSDDNPNETSNASIMKNKKRHDANKKAVCSDDDDDSYDGNPRAVVKRTKKEQAIDNDIAVNLEMPHKIDCPADLEAFDELVEEYVRDELVDLCALVDRIIAWNSVHLPGAVGKENRQSMHNFLDVLLKHFVRVGDSLSINDEEQQKKTLLQV